MKYYFQAFLAGVLLFSVCSQKDPISTKIKNSVLDDGRLKRSIKSTGLIDDFNDGVINKIWNFSSSNNAKVYEANGVLNIDIGAGSTIVGGCQAAGIESEEFILRGDFDV
jgi:hypothetical protein